MELLLAISLFVFLGSLLPLLWKMAGTFVSRSHSTKIRITQKDGSNFVVDIKSDDPEEIRKILDSIPQSSEVTAVASDQPKKR
jgi:hypothetical protein